MMKLFFSCALAAAVVSAPVHAEGAYVGLGVTTATHQLSNSDTKGALKVFGGYDLTPTWGVEAGYMELPGFKTNYALPATGPGGAGLMYSADAKGRAMYVAGKATMAINDRFALVTKLGLGHERVRQTFLAPDSAHSSTLITNELYAGIGLKYSLSKKVALALELERIGNSSQRDSGFKPEKASINASYSF